MTAPGFFTRLLAATLAVILAGCAPADEHGPVVLAPASMQGALEEVAEAWSASGHAAPVLSFAGTPALARQVEQGAPADIVITADTEWMDWLEDRALIAPETRGQLLANLLALVGSEPESQERSIEQRLASLGDGRLAIADPETVPAGRYARATLDAMGLWEQVGAKVVPAENVRAALALVEAGEAQLGIVYATDALASQRVHDAALFDPALTPDITYPAAMVAGAANGEAAAFLEFLSDEEAQRIFSRHGFLPLGYMP